MHVIVCIDERNGMAFQGRRQSMDRLLRSDVLALTAGTPLWMPPYSAGQFEEAGENIRIAEDYLQQAGAGEYCFCELQLPRENIQNIVLYRWNRHYPADLQFPVELLESRSLLQVEEFAGSSHEIITREVYAL